MRIHKQVWASLSTLSLLLACTTTTGLTPTPTPTPVPEVLQCDLPTSPCGDVCVDLASDNANCGACGNACTLQTGQAQVTCSAGRCKGTCAPSYRECAAGCCLQATSVAAGVEHSCAAWADGRVSCWGSTRFTANPNPTGSPNATPVPNIQTAVSVASGSYHSCAIVKNGDVYCWGENSSGELGQGVVSPLGTAKRVLGLARPIVQLALGNKFSCALDVDRVAWCWGFNVAGQLGNSTFVSSSLPQRVRQIGGSVVSIGAGQNAALATTSDGRLYFWGLRVRRTNPGDTKYAEPIEIPIGSDVATQVSMGEEDACWTTQAGKVWCRGEVYKAFPTEDQQEVTGFSGPVRSVLSARAHYCALMRAGGVECWGLNGFGVLGNGSDNLPRSTAPIVASILTSKVRQLAVGNDFNCAILDGDGSLRCWGRNHMWQSKPYVTNVNLATLSEPIEFPGN
jgi:alpha-tubulin suppressor-like RCC1 family protein